MHKLVGILENCILKLSRVVPKVFGLTYWQTKHNSIDHIISLRNLQEFITLVPSFLLYSSLIKESIVFPQ